MPWMSYDYVQGSVGVTSVLLEWIGWKTAQNTASRIIWCVRPLHYSKYSWCFPQKRLGTDEVLNSDILSSVTELTNTVPLLGKEAAST